jgi:NAD(P)-dependent dehydrogenase (short-subunit alcohol dehydrogenase family)
MARSRRKVALVTGAGRGIGFATAREFVDQRYAVVIAERIAPRGKSAARKLRDAGGDVLFVQVDVSKAGAGERAVRTAISKFGALGCLVNNAGVVEVDRLDKLSRRSIEKIVRVNLLGPLLVARAALPYMRRRRRGVIVNVSSLLGKSGEAEFVTYCATKFGVIGMTEALADELRGTGVRTYAVCPTVVDTPMARKAGVTEDPDMIPPEHVARVIVALATGKRRRPSGAAVDVTS